MYMVFVLQLALMFATDPLGSRLDLTAGASDLPWNAYNAAEPFHQAKTLKLAELAALRQVSPKAKLIKFRGKTYRRTSDDKTDGFWIDLGEYAIEMSYSSGWSVGVVWPGRTTVASISQKLGIPKDQKWTDEFGSVLKDGQWVKGVVGKSAQQVPGLDGSLYVYVVQDPQIDFTTVQLRKVKPGSKVSEDSAPLQTDSVELGLPTLLAIEGATAFLSGDRRNIEVEIAKQGPNPYSVQLFWSMPAKASSNTYTLTFEARASDPTTVSVAADLEAAPYTNLGFAERIDLNQEWKRFVFNVSLKEANSSIKLPVFLLSTGAKKVSIRSFVLKKSPVSD